MILTSNFPSYLPNFYSPHSRGATSYRSWSTALVSCLIVLQGFNDGVGARETRNKERLTLAITGSGKRRDGGAPLFTVRVDGVVMHTLFKKRLDVFTHWLRQQVLRVVTAKGGETALTFDDH